MISVTVGTHVSTFTYDGLSRRVEMLETDNGSTTSDTKLVWCWLAICEARDSTGETVTYRYFAQGVQDNGTAYFYTRDHLGSVRELTDSTGTVRARYDHDAWGQRTKLSGDKDANVGFTGHHQHAASGLTLAPFRAYDANLGRWISEDPIGLEGGINAYGYVSDRPTTRVDPFGLEDSVTAAIRNGNFDAIKALMQSPESLTAEQRVLAKKVLTQTTEHLEKLDDARRKLTELTEALEEATGPKSRGPIEQAIQALKKDIAGHIKEISQRWKQCPIPPE